MVVENIKHNPIFDTEKVAKLYTEKDGVPVHYICTTSPTDHGTYAADIFFRETPHPEFGNRYFGLYRTSNDQIMITNADKIEDLDFNMIKVEGVLHYSQHRHDYRCIGGVCIDGGRSYLKRSGDLSLPVVTLKLKDGEFFTAEEGND